MEASLFGVLGLQEVEILNAEHAAQYWTPDQDCAEECRKYAAKRNPLSETWLLCIQVPNSFLAGLVMEELKFCNDWKGHVYLCRRQTTHHRIPAKFHTLSVDADLIKGHICFKLTASLENIDLDEVPQQITQEYGMILNGRKCMQWVFMKKEVVDQLSRLVKGKLHTDLSENTHLRQGTGLNECPIRSHHTNSAR